ncbi:MAG: XRE family transcriptional regulator [Verrucomicrobiaceae bacterium]|nr:MAG: XRE family transcriptional regulator [Verrucomicrobiaceae bacterium]
MPRFKDSPAAKMIDLALTRAARSREDIADEIGIIPGMLSMIRHGSTPLPVGRVQRFAEVLNLDADEIYDAGVISYAAKNRPWATVGAMRTPKKPRISLSTISATKRPQKTSVASP